MKSSTKFLTALVLFLAAVATGAYWHYSPYLAIESMRTAAQERDAQAFNEFVDYPALRENLKGQFALAMGNSIEKAKGQNGLAGMGAALAMAMINPMVDAMVRPEVVMQAMTRSNMELKPLPDAIGTTTKSGSDQNTGISEPKWASRRDGTNRFVVYPVIEGEAPEDQVSAVFVRSGFARWKLTELTIPKLN